MKLVKKSLFQRSVRSFSVSFKELYGPFVNGKYDYPSKLDNFPVFSPATTQPLCSIAQVDEEYVNYAVDVAQQTFESGVWSRSDVRLRATVLNTIAANLRKNIPKLAQLEVAQTGRAIR